MLVWLLDEGGRVVDQEPMREYWGVVIALGALAGL